MSATDRIGVSGLLASGTPGERKGTAAFRFRPLTLTVNLSALAHGFGEPEADCPPLPFELPFPPSAITAMMISTMRPTPPMAKGAPQRWSKQPWRTWPTPSRSPWSAWIWPALIGPRSPGSCQTRPSSSETSRCPACDRGAAPRLRLSQLRQPTPSSPGVRIILPQKGVDPKPPWRPRAAPD